MIQPNQLTVNRYTFTHIEPSGNRGDWWADGNRVFFINQYGIQTPSVGDKVEIFTCDKFKVWQMRINDKLVYTRNDKAETTKLNNWIAERKARLQAAI